MKPKKMYHPDLLPLVTATLHLRCNLSGVKAWGAKPFPPKSNYEPMAGAMLQSWLAAVDVAWGAIRAAGDRMNRKADSAAVRWDVKAAAIVNRMLVALDLTNTQPPPHFQEALMFKVRGLDGGDLLDELRDTATAFLDCALALELLERPRDKAGTTAPSTVDDAERIIREHPDLKAPKIAPMIPTSLSNLKKRILPALEPRGLMRPGRGSRNGYHFQK
jgi:hypothetical protein